MGNNKTETVSLVTTSKEENETHTTDDDSDATEEPSSSLVELQPPDSKRRLITSIGIVTIFAGMLCLSLRKSVQESIMQRIQTGKNTATDLPVTPVSPEIPSLAVELRKQDTPSCSCLNINATSTCCDRCFHRTHKMGTFLSNGLFQDDDRVRTTLEGDGFRRFDNQNADYRDVTLVRNIYDSLISGYLYHKNGNECWLDWYGKKWGRNKPGFKGNVYKLNWPHYIKHKPIPAARGRTLCEYMAQESEMAGMWVYIEWVYMVHYDGILNQWQLAQSRKGQGRTFFVCFEDLIRPETDVVILNKIAEFFYPGSEDGWTGRRTAETEYSEKHSEHSTSHDERLVSRLHGLIEEIDEKYLNGSVAHYNSLLPCQ